MTDTLDIIPICAPDDFTQGEERCAIVECGATDDTLFDCDASGVLCMLHAIDAHPNEMIEVMRKALRR